MPAAKYNMTIEKGSTFNPVFTWKNAAGVLMDLTGYKARMQIRSDIDATIKLVDLSTEHNPPEIVLGGAAGTIAITIPAALTTTLPGDDGVYDLEVYYGTVPNEVVTRLLEGKVKFSAEVTR
jgi:hypothetical protein